MPMPHIFGLALKWDPELHGLLVVLIAMIVLPGSVYLLLATNLGARVGFLIAAAGIFGWMTVMGLVWTVYGIGLKGRPPVWKVKETIVGDVATSSNPVLEGFPKGWKKLPLDNPETAEAGAAADPVLAPPAASGQKGIFTSSSDYLPVGAADRGGEKYFFTLRHKPHYLVLQVQKAIKPVVVPGQAPPKSAPDPTAPAVSVVMLRDLGSLRQPAAVVTGSCGLVFGIICYTLHRRDKEAWAKRELEPVGAGR